MQKIFIGNYNIKTLVRGLCCLSIIVTSFVLSPGAFAEANSASPTATRLVNMPAFKDSISETFTASG